MEKNPAAVELGRRGGTKLLGKYGPKHFAEMAAASAPTKAKWYGRKEFYTLIRYGYKPSQMTKEERKKALNDIRAGRVKRSGKRTFAEIAAAKAAERGSSTPAKAETSGYRPALSSIRY